MTRLPSPRLLCAAGLALAAAACVPRAVPPAPTPAPALAPAPQPAAPPPLAADWQDWPWTPGGWRYARSAGGSSASFGQAGRPAAIEVRCDAATRTVTLAQPGAGAGAFTIRTSATTRSVPVQPLAGAVPQVAARLAATDRLLDAMAFTRGRFTVEQPGAAPLVLPPWAEFARVVEDCRA